MALRALDIVSLERMKDELRQPQTETAHDHLIARHIAGACSFVARHLGAPLVDERTLYWLPIPPASEPLMLPALAVKTIEAVEYWTLTDRRGGDPSGAVRVADLGRLDITRDGAWIWPPAEGWPPMLAGTAVKLTVTRGVDIGTHNEDIAVAVILSARQLYDGYREIRPTEAFFAYIEDFKFQGQQLDGVVIPRVTPLAGSSFVAWSAIPHTAPAFDPIPILGSVRAQETRVLRVPEFPEGQTEGYLVLGLPVSLGFPSGILREGNPHDQRGAFTAENVVPDALLVGVEHFVLVSNEEFGGTLVGKTLTIER